MAIQRANASSSLATLRRMEAAKSVSITVVVSEV